MSMDWKRAVTRCVIAGALMLPIAASAMNGYKHIGYGVKSRGMGGVGVALPQDSLASLSNPAGLVRVCDRWDVGLVYLHQDGFEEFVPFQEGQDGVFRQRNKTDDDHWYFEGGLAYQLCGDQAIGLAISPFGGFKNDYSGEPVLGNGTPMMEFREYLITPSWSFQFDDCHSVGVAVNFAFGWVTIRGLESLAINANSVGSEFPQYFSNRGTDYEGGYGITLGWLGQISNNLILGAKYQSKTWMNQYKSYKGFFEDSGSWDLPPIWGFGFTWCICNGSLLVSGDVERIQWTQVPMLHYDLYNGNRFGDIGGKGFGWNDQTVWKLGVSWDLSNEITVRAGYNYGATPIRSANNLINILTLSTPQQHITGGLTWYLDSYCSEINVEINHAFAHTLRGGGVAPLGITTTGHIDLRNDHTAISASYAQYF